MPWHAMAEGLMPVPDAVRDVVKMVVGQDVDAVMAEHGYEHDERKADDKHAEYKAVMEKLRNMPHMEAMRQLDRYFIGLTPEDRSVISQLLTRPSIHRMAEAARMSADDFADIKKTLQTKLK